MEIFVFLFFFMSHDHKKTMYCLRETFYYYNYYLDDRCEYKGMTVWYIVRILHHQYFLNIKVQERA